MEKKHKRNYKACLNCRVRKVKCDLGSVDNPTDGKCARCRRERKDCVFVESKRGGHANIVNGRRKKELELTDDYQLPSVSNILKPDYQAYRGNMNQMPLPQTSLTSSSSSLVSPSPQAYYERTSQSPVETTQPSNYASSGQKSEEGHFSTMEGALVYLAKAAGTIAKADERDNIDASKRHQQLEENLNDSKYKELITEDNPNSSAIPKHIQDQSNYLSIPITHEFSIRPKGENKLSNIDYIGANGLLTEFEAEMLINLFFTTMHPYFPHIPQFLHKPQVLAGYPILLCAILTIASRYHSLDDNPNDITTGNVEGVPRNIEIHDKLWLYVQRLISQTVWAEASTRSIGTIFAFLLLTEWNPRAIHWRWSDYANVPEENSGQSKDNLAGLGAMRRSYRMAWMLIGSAVRLSQDMGFMEVSPKTFLATHVSEINSVMNISRRSMLSHSLSEIEIDDDVNVDENFDEDDKVLDMDEEEIKEYSLQQPLKFSERQRAKIELLQIMSLSHESLYGYKAQLGSLSQRQNLAILNVISPLLNNWDKKYRHLMKPTTPKNYNLSNNSNAFLDQNSKNAKELFECIEFEGFIFEFNYAKLYIFSLALSSSPKTETDTSKKKQKKVNLKLDEISKSAKYIEHAFFAANEMLSVAHRVHKLKVLRFMPVRWVTRIVRAVAFIVKCYLTIAAHKKSTKNHNQLDSSFANFDATILSLSLIPVDEIMSSIQKAAITLRDCSPDELHLCTRYSNVLMYLCSEMKTNSKNFNDEGINFSGPKYDTLQRDHSSMSVNTTFYQPPETSTNTTVNTPENLKEEVSTPLQNLIGDSEVMEWFLNNRNIGLDFVAPWTEMIEQQLNSSDQFNFDNAMM
ncbi:transcriptional activator Aro80p [[Candida] jaroonii]|uniref:Transcriptional activator Aro80p n=1 Tax=[Candida] jaroonii TaxID=467808 RepID=A0ACA9YE92_9ASCO|nr:transcriptional activator Aro80p [[Candida] jaroonii]